MSDRRYVYLIMEEGKYVARVFASKRMAWERCQEFNERYGDIRFTVSKRTIETRKRDGERPTDRLVSRDVDVRGWYIVAPRS